MRRVALPDFLGTATSTELAHRTRALLRRNKKRYVRGLAEDVECHLNSNDLRPAYQSLKKLHSKSTSQVSAIRTADGCLLLAELSTVGIRVMRKMVLVTHRVTQYRITHS